jgi:hypothetical protein
MNLQIADIPVFIVNKNWLTPMRKLIDWLIVNGTKRIVILDNGSTYPPLLDYYRSLPAEVELRPGDPNDWQYRFWNKKIYEEFDTPYVMTDPDVFPADCCPGDLIMRLWGVLQQRRQYGKVGPGLRIDNLPDAHPAKASIVAGQSHYWKSPLGGGYFSAAIDTTFAIYGERSSWVDHSHGIRMDFPYVFEHYPWYIWPLTEEAKFYVRNVNRNVPSGIVWWTDNIKEMQEAMQ